MPMSPLSLNLLKSSVLTLVLYVGGARLKWWFFFVSFLGLCLIDVIFSKLEADDRLFDDVMFPGVELNLRAPNTQEEIQMLLKFMPIECLTAQERTYYEKKVALHRSNAERTWTNAKNKCWYLPDISKRKAAQNAFNTVIASFGGSTPMSKLVFTLIGALASYGVDCIDEWYYIEEQLGWCQHHCEMVEFYLTVLERG